MADDIQVRTVRVEFLRAGPSHNQLLSPLTPYLAICDDAEAGVVHVPFEQHTFERRMRALRHQDQSEDRGERPAEKDRLPSLRELGVAMAKLLGSVPRFPGSLSADPNGRNTLVRVSLTLSAAELAALPFELSKVPIGPDAHSESWLSVQSKVPVVITRRTRNVSNTRMNWLQSPRVLFVAAGDGNGPVPFEEHQKAMIEAVKPFALSSRFGQKARLQAVPGKDGMNNRKTYGDMLTVLSNASLDGVVKECRANRYTHVHILGHGGRDEDWGDRNYGLLLHPDDGVISGERLASALTGTLDDQLHRPQVVTLATCDSANSDDVVNPGASLAHALHQAGIPLVVASQVPLGFAASIIFAGQFYGGLLWGEHPWLLMHRIRSALHGRLKPVEHDWASLVVYEALPSEMNDALERAAYQQCRRAVEVAYASGHWVGSEALDNAIDRLAMHGKTYAMEARALRAEARMINARDEAFDVALNPGRRDADALLESYRFRRWCMEAALQDYEVAITGFLVKAGQGLQAPFRPLLAKFSIQLVLGKPLDWGDWHVARIWAETMLAHAESPAEDKGWAQACLAELWLLRLLDNDAPAHSLCMQRATASLRDTVQIRQPKDGFAESPTYWLEYRLFGYMDAWAQPQLREGSALGTEDAPQTQAPLNLTIVTDAAQRLLRRLNRLDNLLGLRDEPAARAGHRAKRGPADDGPSMAGAALDDGAYALLPASEAVPQSYAQGASPRPQEPPTEEPKLLGAVKPKPAAKASGLASASASALASTAVLSAAPPSSAAQATKAAIAAAAKPARRANKPGTTAATSTTAAIKAADAVFNVELLPVDQGDSLFIEWGSSRGQRWRMLIDCGTEGSFKRALGPRIAQLPADQRHFELFILSHIDSDHIGGGIALLQQAKALGVSFGDIWFNGRQHLESAKLLSAKDGDDFSQLLVREKMPWNRFTDGKPIVRPHGDKPEAENALPSITLPGGMVLTVLSPTPSTLTQLAGTWDEELASGGKRRLLAGRQLEGEEDLNQLLKRPFKSDDSRPNGSSIAVLAEFAGKRALLAADAYADVLASAIARLLKPGQKRLTLDVFKLSHHGSRGNMHNMLMSLVDCPNYLVSSSGAIFSHPDREALARVVRGSSQPATLWFNYPLPERDREYHALWAQAEFQKRWGFKAVYPQDATQGLRFNVAKAQKVETQKVTT